MLSRAVTERPISHQRARRICGLDGNDFVFGGNGNDRILLDNGRNIAFGEAGDDDLRGADGNDRLFGAGGNDHLACDGIGLQQGIADFGNGGAGVDTQFACETIVDIP